MENASGLNPDGDTRVGSNPIICMSFAERLDPLLHLVEWISGRDRGNGGTRSVIKTFRRTAVTSRLHLEKLCDILCARGSDKMPGGLTPHHSGSNVGRAMQSE